MKNLLLIVYIIVIQSQAVCQISHEYTFVRYFSGTLGQEFFLTNLGNDDYKYVLYDYDSSKFSLFNIDYTPFLMNIPVPVTSNLSTNTIYRLGYISKDLFDCDSTTIEFAMMLNTPRPQVSPNFGVYRTDGTVLFTKDTVGTIFCVGCGSGSYEMHPIMNTSDGAKLYLFNNVGNAENIFIYGLCGSLPLQIPEKSFMNEYVQVFPNPATRSVNFAVQNTTHLEKVVLTIINSTFKKVSTINLYLT